MSISYPISFPDDPNIAKWVDTVIIRAVSVNAVTVQPDSLQEQIVRRGGARWEADITFRKMMRNDFAAWQAFFVSLKGRFGTFTMGDPDARLPIGTGAGSPKVNGAHAKGAEVLATKSWGGNQKVLKAGDYISVNNRLYMSMKDVQSGGGGNANIDVFPPLREAHSNNSVVEVEDPKGTWRMATDEISWSSDNAGVFSLNVSVQEANL